jgi:hypothetical protein
MRRDASREDLQLTSSTRAMTSEAKGRRRLGRRSLRGIGGLSLRRLGLVEKRNSLMSQ